MSQTPADSYARTDLTTPSRYPGRVGYERRAVHAVLDEATVAHVGFVVDGEPVVLPHLYARDGETLYLHGSTGARALQSARAGGLEVCVTVLALELEQCSLKMRTGPPQDDEADLDGPYWAGVLPVPSSTPQPAVPAPDLRPGVEVPEHVARWVRSGRPGPVQQGPA